MYGVNEAEQLCQYYSKVYSKQTHRFEDLPPLFKMSIIHIGQNYEQNLRYPGAGPTPGSLRSPKLRRRLTKQRKHVMRSSLKLLTEWLRSLRRRSRGSMPKKAPPPLPAIKADSSTLNAKTKRHHLRVQSRRNQLLLNHLRKDLRTLLPPTIR